ncbi:endonuclease III [Candidatus Nitrospira bockiana]
MAVKAKGRGGLRVASGVKQRVARILAKLETAIPHPRVELTHESPLQLLVATILSAQCTDERVNQVTPRLFSRYPRPLDYARADPAELEAMIRPTGFYRSKARSLIALGQALHERFGDAVPRTMDELTTLPGVGRKTANVLLGACFGEPAVVVDTHVKRVAQRLALTMSDDPDVIEQDLQRLLPPDQWTSGSHRLLLHGRYTCLARNPKCERCPIYEECRWEGKRRR